MPPPEIIRPLLSHAKNKPHELGVALFVDQQDGSAVEGVSMDSLQTCRIDKPSIQTALGIDVERTWWRSLLRFSPTTDVSLAEKKVLFLVCGPEP